MLNLWQTRCNQCGVCSSREDQQERRGNQTGTSLRHCTRKIRWKLVLRQRWGGMSVFLWRNSSRCCSVWRHLRKIIRVTFWLKSSQGLIGPRSTARSRQAVLICLKEQEDFCYILCQVVSQMFPAKFKPGDLFFFPKHWLMQLYWTDLHRYHSTCCHSVKQLADVLTRRSFSELFPSLPPSSLKTFDDRRAKLSAERLTAPQTAEQQTQKSWWSSTSGASPPQSLVFTSAGTVWTQSLWTLCADSCCR